MANKYGNIKGNGFDSRKEANRYAELMLLQRGHKISDLRRQVEYILIPSQYDGEGRCIERSCKYIADFVYHDETGRLVVEDVKGYKKGQAYAVFSIKRKLMLHAYGIRIKEV